MKGDFSRIRLSKKREREKNYRKVLFQQGRVLAESDINDLVLMDDQQKIQSLRDIIGKNGIPLEEKDSFKITPKGGNKYTIGKGRIYVDGILVENFREVGGFPFSDGTANVISQPYLPSPSAEGEPSDAVPTEPGIYLAYLKVMDGHVTYIEDPDIQESALGDSDTSTRLQTRWQVLLHKLEDADIPKENPNKWAPWINLGNEDAAKDIRIGTNNDGSLLEVFALPRARTRMSIREESLEPEVKWESNWDVLTEDFITEEFDIASRHADNLEILYMLVTEDAGNNFFIREDMSRWGRREDANRPPRNDSNGLIINQIKLVMNANNNLELFATREPNSDDKKIYHTKQENSLTWTDWRPIQDLQSTKFSVILNPEKCIEIYAIANEDSTIRYTKQLTPDSNQWDVWKPINPDDPKPVSKIFVGLNGNNQVVIFVSESETNKVWSTLRTEEDSVGNGWSEVGGDNQPGLLIQLSLQNNPKKKRLEAFGIFIFPAGPTGFGNIWNITEDKNGEWKSKWKNINENLLVSKIASATDKKDRVNIFAIEGRTGIVHHSYLEDTEPSISCQLDIPSWESKIKPSTLQLKARARPQEPLPDDPCLLPEQAGYRRLENQLYRIEIHEPPKSADRNATFKYSRDNGTVCSKIIDISGEKITVASIGRDRLLGFNREQRIEVTDDLHELWGIPGVLARINNVNGTDLIFDSTTLIPPTAKIDNNSFPQQFNPKVRRWDSPGLLDVKIPPTNNGWIGIEDGIEVKFNNIDNCKTGDYVTIPARTLKADIEWPKGPDGLPEFVDIEGIEYHYAKLALLKFFEGELTLISDCRDFFSPLERQESKNIIYWTHGMISDSMFPNRPGFAHRKDESGSTYDQQNHPDPGGSVNVFLFPTTVSYPLELHNKKITLQRLHLRYNARFGAKITEIRIHDGLKRLEPFKDLSLSGRHDDNPDDSNTFDLDAGIEVKQSIIISVVVSFIGDQSGHGFITFSGVGLQLKID